MTHSPEWLVLTGAFPREPEHGNLDQLTTLPGPGSLLQALFRDLCGIDLNDLPRRHDTTAGDGDLRHFIIGDGNIGFRQSERTPAATSSLPMSVAVATFGLPETGLQWNYRLEHMGQLGHCAFRHDRLLAAFATDQARRRFERIWQRVFDRAPVFEIPETPPPQ